MHKLSLLLIASFSLASFATNEPSEHTNFIEKLRKEYEQEKEKIVDQLENKTDIDCPYPARHLREIALAGQYSNQVRLDALDLLLNRIPKRGSLFSISKTKEPKLYALAQDLIVEHFLKGNLDIALRDEFHAYRDFILEALTDYRGSQRDSVLNRLADPSHHFSIQIQRNAICNRDNILLGVSGFLRNFTQSTQEGQELEPAPTQGVVPIPVSKTCSIM